MKKLLAILAVAVLVLAGCGSSNGSIAAGGSTSVQPLFASYIDEYTALNPDVKITYDGQGSSKGIEGINNGTYQIGALSRSLKDSEKASDISVETIALDGIAVVVANDNPVKDLTMEQVQKIYTGEITNWSEVGGNDALISVVSRDSASGTREAFETIVEFGKGDEEKPLTQKAIEFNSNGGVAESVAQNVDAIGYISMETLKENSDKLQGTKIGGIEPTEENAKIGTYELFRPFIIVYKEKDLTESSKDFIKWVQENAEKMATEAGFIAAQ